MVEEKASDSRERIMDATYQALIETGYANLTMSDIAAKSETSTSLLHYHFDTKEDLLVAFLDHVYGRLERNFETSAEKDPTDRLHHILSFYVLDPGEIERESFHIALSELRGQAPYNERYQERFTRTDELLISEMTHIIEDGIDRGHFETSDPEGIALLLIATADGARTKGTALGDPSYTRGVLEELYEHVLDDLFEPVAADRWRELEAS